MGYDTGPEIWMDYSSRPFSLEGNFLNSTKVTIHSSKGGVYMLLLDLVDPRAVSFSDGDSEGIKRPLFMQGGAGVPQGLDQIVLRVELPATLALPPNGLIAACAVRRRVR